MIETTYLVSLLGLGLVLGLRHALDADHVIAVSTIVSRTGSLKKSSLYGVMWGVGHTATLLLVGVLILGFKLALPDKLALSFEFIVGIVLVALGVDVIRKIRLEKLHLHEHTHDGDTHTHLHSHKEGHAHGHSHKSFIVGMIHGLAGSAALTLLVLTTVKSVMYGLLYILIFGIGSTAGMLLVSAVIGLPFIFAARFDRIHGYIGALAGIISILFGLMLMYEIGFHQKLFF